MQSSAAVALALVTVVCLSGCFDEDATTPPATTPTGSSPGGATTSTAPSATPRGAPDPMHVHVANQGSNFDAPRHQLELGTRVDFHAHAPGHTVTIHRSNSTGYLMDETPALDEAPSITFGEPGTYQVFCRYHSSGASGNYQDGMVTTLSVAPAQQV